VASRGLGRPARSSWGWLLYASGVSISAGQEERSHFTPGVQIKTELQSWLDFWFRWANIRAARDWVSAVSRVQTGRRHQPDTSSSAFSFSHSSSRKGSVAFPAGFEVAQVQPTLHEGIRRHRGGLSWPLGIIIFQIGPSSTQIPARSRPAMLPNEMP